MIQNITRKFNWSDLDLDFIAHPTTGDVVKKTGVDAVKRSIRNLVLTNFYERKFNHSIGSNVQKLLFENINPLVAGFLKDAVIEVITNLEPRAELVQENDGVLVDADYDEHGYNVSVTFRMNNSGIPVTFSLFLERLR